ncbi:hypothetical protein K461DRAFT_303829 [Myriangium duriaei CBS 260.36]|uniref:Uncharacterized protein n=1 Tax=Myriangium duriaei CBS 260.36 TaxID=1168546 RepID=A0A9P4J9H8_9PEZI|nr:hypothetical protein K461DRAFT_303829 [Myriangium duriaei CBS 260.36]
MACIAIWEGNLSLTAKLSSSALLAIGCLGAIASTIRFALVIAPVDASRYTQQLIEIFKMCVVETGICLIAANVIMIRPLVNIIMIKAGFTHEKSTVGLAPTIGRVDGKPANNMIYGVGLGTTEVSSNHGGIKTMPVVIVVE